MITGDPKDVLLPQSESELDALVAEVSENYGLPVGDETYEAIATAIMHIPQQTVFVAPEHFATAARRYWASKAAYGKLEAFRAKRKAAEEAAKLSLVPKEPDAANEQPVQNS